MSDHLPAAGGSYVREKDGTLRRAPEPAGEAPPKATPKRGVKAPPEGAVEPAAKEA